jgi:hypothetical protein
VAEAAEVEVVDEEAEVDSVVVEEASVAEEASEVAVAFVWAAAVSVAPQQWPAEAASAGRLQWAASAALPQRAASAALRQWAASAALRQWVASAALPQRAASAALRQWAASDRIMPALAVHHLWVCPGRLRSPESGAGSVPAVRCGPDRLPQGADWVWRAVPSA